MKVETDFDGRMTATSSDGTVYLEKDTIDRYCVSFSDVTESEARAIVQAVRLRLAPKVEG